MTPILYSFRRCPYAMRARLALLSSGQTVELREILLRDKPAAFLESSPSATVPCLVTEDGVIDESRDIMVWALEKKDPGNWLHMPGAGNALIDEADGPFKAALDRTKYASRFPDADAEVSRTVATSFLACLDDMLAENRYLFGGSQTLADTAILPFVRQFAFVDKARFDAEPLPNVHRWLEEFLASKTLESIMVKYDTWQDGAPPVYFP